MSGVRRARMTAGQQRALVTGGAGFIGSHLADALLARGTAVTVLDDLSTGKRGHLASHEGRVGFSLIIGSVLDTRIVERAVLNSDVVYHLAAAVGVRNIV